MTTRIIEFAAAYEGADPVVAYTDPVHGDVVDYIAESVPDSVIYATTTLYACSDNGPGYTIHKGAPADFAAAHTYAGWPQTDAPAEQEQ